MSVFSVLPIGPFDRGFSYEFDGDLQVGDIVEAPFGSRTIVGVTTDEKPTADIELKKISKVFGLNIGETNYDFLKWVADYSMIPRGMVLKMILAEKAVFGTNKIAKASSLLTNQSEDQGIKNDPQFCGLKTNEGITLNASQAAAYQKIVENGARPFLLNGVTGSGKTEIYLSAVRDVLAQKKQALILFPEIALIGQIVKRVEKYFGFRPFVWNSNITPKNKRIAWLKALSGEPCVVMGARSALFIPFKNLGIIVVDEEHDSSYKQEEGGFYNARDMAVVRGHLRKIPAILSSATPSIESRVNAENGKYGYAAVANRFGSSKMPEIHLIDMRQVKADGFISPALIKAIKSAILKGEQCLIYLNRRGYSPIVLCKSCGDKIACPNCSGWLVYHKNIDKLICHYCDHRIDIPRKCLACGEEGSYIPFGPGVERIFEELQKKLPETRIEIASSDTIASAKNIDKLFEKIANNEVDIIIGTQIFAKGHHFPNITLVGIIDGDLGLSGADIRAAEKTYQLVNQVAGRAGREEKQGQIFIQTFSPDHSLYVALKSDNPDDFIKMEIESRKNNGMPPFSRLAAVIVSGTNRELTEKVAKKLGESRPRGAQIFGPAPAPFFLLRGRTRWRFLLKSTEKKSLNRVVKRWLSVQKIPKNIKIQIDIDPISFL
ncbi:MAG: primosomal protein N' [Holosporaceae bacterium]|jgi:primosomal protein N' (replication factor Y)|nr:primosomal protein N' [Holosporaceae bacterium]